MSIGRQPRCLVSKEEFGELYDFLPPSAAVGHTTHAHHVVKFLERVLFPMTLETPHLRLLPVSPGQLLALVRGEMEFERAFGLPAAEGLGGFGASSEISPDWLAKLRTAKSADPWVHGFMIVDRESNSVIGTCGFKGPPDTEGMVEIAYGIVDGFRCRGYATEAAAALVKFAIDSGQVQFVRAHTLPENLASMRVLEKCGFKRVGQVLDPDDGLVWRFERLIF